MTDAIVASIRFKTRPGRQQRFQAESPRVRFKAGTLEIEPALAKSWDIAPDGLTYTFHLRDGVKFHDGTDFNADAVKFTFDRMLDKTSKYYDTGPFPMSFLFSSIKETKVVDPMTVQFTLSEPFAPLLTNLAGVSASMLRA